MNGERREPTQDELDWLKANGLRHLESWNFQDQQGRIFDLSAADLTQIQHIKELGLFLRR